MLSKSLYIRGRQCHKSLWLHKHRQDLREQPSEADIVRMEAGTNVGELGRQLCPGGELIEFDAGDFNGMIGRTSQLIEQGCETIYEASFREDEIFAMCDILQKTHTGWEMYEVKATSEVKDYHTLDAAIQWHVLSKAGLNLSRVAIVHVNTSYKRMGELDIKSLFTIQDITAEIKNMQGDIPAQLQGMKTMLAGDEPDIDIGPHCSKPFPCDFQGHCWRKIPKQSVFNLYRLKAEKKWGLYHQGIIKLTDIPADRPLNPTQRLQVQSLGKAEPVIDKEVIQNFLDTISSPTSYLDFETFTDVIPRFDGQRPYQKIPFQYSLHIEHGAGVPAKDSVAHPDKDSVGTLDNGDPSGPDEDSTAHLDKDDADSLGKDSSSGSDEDGTGHLGENGGLTHKEFLADVGIDPRRALAEKLIADLPKQGTIVTYNAGFERRVIKELAGQFDDLSDELLAFNKRVIDLIVPFRRLGYYHDKMNGSFSLKSVLPALFPDDDEIGYQGLSIQEGGMASDTFANLHLVEDPQDVENIRKDLLAYCRMDTLAMVKIMDKLRQAAQ